jgi:hypothetical protein
MDTAATPDRYETQTPSFSKTDRVYAGTRVALAICATLLVALGVRLCWKHNDGGILAPYVAFVPAIVYATGAFVFGRRLCLEPDARLRGLAWSRLLWITAGLYCAAFVPFLVFMTFGDASYIEAYQFWLAAAVTTALLALWAQIGSVEFACEPARTVTDFQTPTRKLAFAFMFGGAATLSSLLLNVGYESSGWSILTGERAWVTNEFITIGWTRSWLNNLTLVMYVLGILLAVSAVAAGIMILRRKSMPSKVSKFVLSLVAVVACFTLTNYYFDYLYLIYIGIFHFGDSDRLQFSIITAVWLTVFLVGTVLWLRYGMRTDERTRSMRAALALSAIPLLAFPIGTSWYAAAWELYGLVTYIFGLQIIAACWWRFTVVTETNRLASVRSGI